MSVRSKRERPPRVLIIVQNLPVSLDRRVWLEALALRDAGFDVNVISPMGAGARRSREVLEGIHVLRYPTFEARRHHIAFLFEFTWCWLATFILALRLAAGRGFDVIHACNPPDTFFALALLFRPLGKRFVFDQHDLCPEVYLSKYPNRVGDLAHRALLQLERWTYNCADVVIATNDSYRSVAVARGRVEPERVFVVRSGPDPERVFEVPPDAAERHGARLVLGYLGTMSVQDGVDGLLRIFSLIVHEHERDDVHLVLVGGGPLLEELRGLARELDVDARVTFTGRIPDGDQFRRVMCSMDVCVGPDPPGPLNDVSTMNKTMEYMAFGRPVASYALKETLVSGGDAVAWARPGDEKDLARVILELLDDPERRAKQAELGRARVRERLSWEHSIPCLLAAYRCALRQGATTAGPDPTG